MQEHSGPPMPPPVGRTWEMFGEEQVLHGPDELAFGLLQPGDQLVVVTTNTRYEFDWLEGGGVLLKTDRTDRPFGQVTLTGCAFRRSGAVAPGVVFRGGRLIFLSMNGQLQHKTALITSVTLSRPVAASAPGEAELAGAGR